MMKSCSFCGEDGGDIQRQNRPSDGSVRFLCRNCGAVTPYLPTLKDAERFWNSGYYTIPTHDERKILDACIQLMAGMVDSFQEYCDYMGWKADPENEEEHFSVRISYREIVKRLFLWHTHHSGGTSSEAKCQELGIEDGGKRVVFEFETEIQDEDEGAEP